MSGDNYGNCDGVYDLTSNLEQGSPVYLHTQKNRVLALYEGKWACRGTSNGLPIGTWYVSSKYLYVKYYNTEFTGDKPFYWIYLG